MTELCIEALAAGGRGVARSGGKVWFVEGALPGDRVEARPLREAASFVEARTSTLIEASPQRRVPPCPYQARCGGCPWMPLPEGEQRAWKARLVADALSRVGRIEQPPVAALVTAGQPLGYRNKVELALGRDASGAASVGYHAPGATQAVLDVEQCAVLAEPGAAVLRTARWDLLAAGRDPATFDADLRLVLRVSTAGKVLVAIREAGRAFPEVDAFAETLWQAHRPTLTGVVRIRGASGRRGGSRTVALRGRATMSERFGGFEFRLPAATFLQVNPAVAEVMAREVCQACGDVSGQTILDLYAGVGVLGLSLASRARHVTLCEADHEAVRCGRRAAGSGRAGTVEFVHADVGRFLRQRRDAVDVVIANPPRTGMARGIPEAIAALAPSRIVIVSCDPATLARDVRGLATAGYRLEKATPFDMFPQTAHVETVAELHRA